MIVCPSLFRAALALAAGIWLPLSASADEEAITFTAEESAYWAFQPLTRPEVPEVTARHGDWPRSPVDRFILARQEALGLSPSDPAEARTLLRRAHYDLLGLPASIAAVRAFEAETARWPDAYGRELDRLLASPRHGEHWARHWLDLVRYADSNGYKSDEYRPNAWRYRDYVVGAFNADKPYDRFMAEQLAGDELAPANPEALVATGFLRHWPYESNQRDLDTHWEDIINEVTDVTADVFLGLSMHCARCHDHKFDPLSQKDYFKLRSFFVGLYPDDELVAATPEEREVHSREMRAWLDSTSQVRAELARIEQPALARAEQPAIEKFHEKYQELLEVPDKDLSAYQKQIRFMADRVVRVEHKNMAGKIAEDQKAGWAGLRERLARHEPKKPAPLSPVMAVREVDTDVPPTFIPGREKAGEVYPGFPTILEPNQTASLSIRATDGPAGRSSGRRLALARWLTREDHPLTTRVMANRVWQYHFGRGLAPSASDFGRQGGPPTHPELLDWLARDLVTHGWSLKHLHRELMGSAAYRQTALREPSSGASLTDAENIYLWRGSIRRLQAEQIRDTLLLVSGELDLTMGGPGEDTEDSTRRSIFLKVFRNSPEPVAEAFDGADGFNSVAHRETTTTAPQALLLMNGEWAHARAHALAAQVLDAETAPPLTHQITRMYEKVMGREPTPTEQGEAEAFVRVSASRREGLYDLCHLLLNSNELLYVE